MSTDQITLIILALIFVFYRFFAITMSERARDKDREIEAIQKAKMDGEIEQRIATVEAATKNLAVQCLDEISKIKDRLGIIQHAAGVRSKTEQK